MINHFRDTLDQGIGFQNRGHGIACEAPMFCGFPRTVALAESTEVRRKRAPGECIWPAQQVWRCRDRCANSSQYCLSPGAQERRRAVLEKALAERVGFEPTIRFPVYTLSKRAPSATRPPLRTRRAQYNDGPRRDNPRGTGRNSQAAAGPGGNAGTYFASSSVNKQSLMRQHRRTSWDAGYCFGSSAFHCRSFC